MDAANVAAGRPAGSPVVSARNNGESRTFRGPRLHWGTHGSSAPDGSDTVMARAIHGAMATSGGM
jgi:hypothetical protein